MLVKLILMLILTLSLNVYANTCSYKEQTILNNDFSKYNVDKVLIGNISHVKEFKGKEIYADNSLNAFNSYTCEYLKGLGVKGVNLSFELNL